MSTSRGLTRSNHVEGPRAPTKIVYASEESFETDAITVLSPKQLDVLMEAGWTIQTSTKRKVSDAKGKKVSVDYIVLEKVIERSVTRHRESDPDNLDGGRALSTNTGNNGSFLGSGSDFAGVPGLSIRGSKSLDNAYGMGVDCVKTGGSREDCPFPSGDKFHEQWMRGFNAGEADTEGGVEPAKADPVAMREAYAYGKQAATGPKALEVTCPYPERTKLFTEWLRGFTENGGEHQEVNPDMV